MGVNKPSTPPRLIVPVRGPGAEVAEYRTRQRMDTVRLWAALERQRKRAAHGPR